MVEGLHMKIMTIFGTRPEQLKLKSTVQALRDSGTEVEEWWTGQSPDLVKGEPRHDWSYGITQGIADTIAGTRYAFDRPKLRPDAILVAGDTASAFAGALAGFLVGVPVGHIEAGLRTYVREPWPEEQFRRMIADISTWHFCPDENSACNVLREIVGLKVTDLGWGVGMDHKRQEHNVFVVGNPIIDTLSASIFNVLVTMHRRENWGFPLEETIEQLFNFHADHEVDIKIISHPNWKSHLPEGIVQSLRGQNMLLDPMPHEDFQDLLVNASVVVTDSGGLQEEAAHYGIPCLVVRESTERTALEQIGAVKCISPDQVKQGLDLLLSRRTCYGDGTSGIKIAQILIEELSKTID